MDLSFLLRLKYDASLNRIMSNSKKRPENRYQLSALQPK
jgi:hypothetical protein